MEFRDLKQQYKVLKSKIDDAIAEVLEEYNFIGGRQIYELEERLASYVGVKHCITCANGTDALSMVLMAWDVGLGDAVFVPDFTFFATAEVVSFVGATPIFVDVDENTFNMDPNSLEQAIQKVQTDGKLHPKAVIPVDLFGLPANYRSILPIAEKYNLLVLEDGAQGFGGTLDGKQACSFGNAAATSFFPAKPLGCYGDGGAVFINDDGMDEYLRSIQVHGKGSNKYDNVRIGWNSRLDTLQAAILLVKLDAFEEQELASVQQVATWYEENLPKSVKPPVVPSGFTSSWAQYTIQLDNRDAVQKQLKEAGIPTMVYYPKPLHTQQAFSHLLYDGYCPVTEQLCERVLSLPMHGYLKENAVSRISKVLRHFLADYFMYKV